MDRQSELIKKGLALLYEQQQAQLLSAHEEVRQAEDLLGEARARAEGLQAELQELAQLLGLEGPASSGGLVPATAPRSSIETLKKTVRVMRRNRDWRVRVTSLLLQILGDGQRRHATQLLQLLLDRGVSFEGIGNPVHRIVQIMSADERFDSNRSEGWGLKNEDPGATGSPATSSDDDL